MVAKSHAGPCRISRKSAVFGRDLCQLFFKHCPSKTQDLFVWIAERCLKFTPFLDLLTSYSGSVHMAATWRARCRNNGTLARRNYCAM